MKKAFRWYAVSLLLLILALPAVSFAAYLDSSVIGMFPQDVDEFGCADLSQARDLSWFPQFESQLVPVALFGFERFLEAAELRQTSPIEQVAWARVTARSGNDREARAQGNAQLVAVAVGEFDADAIQLAVKTLNIPSVQIGNYTLYDAGTGSGPSDVYFTLVDWRTIAFGPLPQIERIINIRSGDESNLLSNGEMMTLIDEANGEGMFWGVLNSSRASSVLSQLVPGVADFPQLNGVIGKMKELMITVKAPSDIELNIQAVSSSSADAVLFSELLQAGVLLRRYQPDAGNNPELAKLLDAISISADGSLLHVSLNLTNDQLVSLIEHNTFVI